MIWLLHSTNKSLPFWRLISNAEFHSQVLFEREKILNWFELVQIFAKKPVGWLTDCTLPSPSRCASQNSESRSSHFYLLTFYKRADSTFNTKGREPWSSGYGWHLNFERLWVQIPAPYTGWTFLNIDFLYQFIVCVKRLKINQKRGLGWPI